MGAIPMIRKDNIVTKIEKLNREYELLKKGSIGDRRLKSRKKRILRYFSTTLDVAHGCADHDDQPGGQRVSSSPKTGARPSRKDGRSRGFRPCLLRRRGNLFFFFAWKRPAAFSARKKERLPLSSSVRSSSPAPSSKLQHFSCCPQMRIRSSWRSESCEAVETGPLRTFVLPALAATLDRTQSDRSFRDIRAD
ncbi:hypothetical protein GWK47_015099 [Chionoecetes opilio]|uniref:Uncharacterized protein n=1 Tax=Chionoecetes opilio TaxID=41210 RepID=A0A8J4XSN5_CHIOP|nr:hypothetical protein GWK47_015099 [Chionoecetes opilio]